MGFGHIGFSELLVIFLIVLVLFGAKRLPEIGKSLGSGIREFKKAGREIQKEVSLESEESAKRPPDASVQKPPPVE